MPKLFNVTYEIVTPESAEHGDAAERGYIGALGLQFDMSEIWGKAAAAEQESHAMTLRQAVSEVGGCLEDCGRWFSQVDGCQNYRTGAVESRSIHPPANITPASYGRLARLLGVPA